MDKVAYAIDKAVAKIQATLDNAVKIEKDVFITRPGFYLGGMVFKKVMAYISQTSFRHLSP